ncbi:CPBP family intramembrane metalloprotease [Carboxylicivirga sp. A043]|uniref:CPBP family intramembrane glutamic endopeptidase n=1 Tax=Carboxylicivirga litoralis TaxID=2816963 RepID=UPI0021CB451E|nr:type II CAAX endopeptidase family protein [Carboxylicivirga sp. A043]MCU4156297.1 CPBP family intramembrane metalloprotease [Carboxylicivirga sp. A043]
MNTQKIYPSLAQSWGITGITILCMILFTPINMILIPVMGKEYAMLTYYILTMGVAFFIAHLIRKNETQLKHYPLNINRPELLPLIIFGALGLVFGIVNPIGNLIPMPDLFKEMFKELASLNGFGAFAMMVIAAPLFEELIFRGIILDGMLKRYSPAKAIFWSSFLFGFVHLNPWQFVTGLVIGAFIGWVYYRTRSLSISMIIHAAVNGTSFFLKFLMDEEAMLDQSFAESFGGITNAILVTGGAIVVAVVCILLLKRQFGDNELFENKQPEL